MARAAGRASLAVGVAIAAFATGFACLSVLRHRAFSTGRFDLGNMVQAVWSTAHGHPLRVTDLAGEQMSRLGAHVDPILVAFAPLWWLWPSPSMLLVAQAVAIALGALPVYWLARKKLASPRAGVAFALAYLLYPATTWLALNEFHPVALATPALLFAFWFLDEDRLLPFAAFALVAALSKEEIPLVIAAMGIWYAFAHGRRAAGVAIALAGVAWSVVAIEVVIPHFNHGVSPFEGRYSEVGGSPSGIAHTALHHPRVLLHVAFQDPGPSYLLDLVLPLAALCLLSPVVLVALPELVLNLLSSVATQSSIHFHYTAGEIPPLVVAAIFGAARICRRGDACSASRTSRTQRGSRPTSGSPATPTAALRRCRRRRSSRGCAAIRRGGSCSTRTASSSSAGCSRPRAESPGEGGTRRGEHRAAPPGRRPRRPRAAASRSRTTPRDTASRAGAPRSRAPAARGRATLRGGTRRTRPRTQ